MKTFQRLKLVSLAFFIAAASTLTIFSPQASAAFNKNQIMSDLIFDKKGSMSASQIDAFLNARSHSCISTNRGFAAKLPTGYSPTGGFTFGSYASAGSVIHAAAQAYDINPQILIVTLEKEQSLVTGRNNFSGYCNNGSEHKYASAMGYGCPDSGGSHSYSNVSLYRRNGVVHSTTGSTCVNTKEKAGFSQQVIRAAWLLKFAQQRSRGNINWSIVRGNWDNSDDPQSCYSGPMTRGTWRVCPSGSATYYDGYRTIDGSATLMGSGATAAFYWYTPHFHGNQLLVSLFEDWFGSTQNGSCYNSANVSGAAAGRKIVASQQNSSGSENLIFTQRNNTGSKCVEAHTWRSGYTGWAANKATNLGSMNPASSTIISGNVHGDKRDELMLVKYSSGSGKVEVHAWSNDLWGWVIQKATVLHNISPTSGATAGDIISGDTDGDGRDEVMYVKYSGESSKVEIHTMNANLSSWRSNVVTALHGINPTTGPTAGRIIAGDRNGDGKDELMYVKFDGESNKVEVHTFSQNLKSWSEHKATVLHGITPNVGEIVAGDVDNDNRDELIFVKFDGESNKVEVHTLNTSLYGWSGHAATNLAGYTTPF